MNAHLCLQENTKGIDWVVGDLHGCYDKLFKKLYDVQFNFDNDRLICSGDMIDRGRDSKKVVELLDEVWFYSTLGNHELMCLDAYKYDWAMDDFTRNGGMWFYHELPMDQDRIVERFMDLPLTIRFPVQERSYLVVHARIPRDDILNPNMHIDRGMEVVPADYIADAVWDRHITNPFGQTTFVQGFDMVFCGHTVVSEVTQVANYLDLDTGVVFDASKDFVLYNTKSEEIV